MKSLMNFRTFEKLAGTSLERTWRSFRAADLVFSFLHFGLLIPFFLSSGSGISKRPSVRRKSMSLAPTGDFN